MSLVTRKWSFPWLWTLFALFIGAMFCIPMLEISSVEKAPKYIQITSVFLIALMRDWEGIDDVSRVS
jgi:hypothetical protein